MSVRHAGVRTVIHNSVRHVNPVLASAEKSRLRFLYIHHAVFLVCNFVLACLLASPDTEFPIHSWLAYLRVFVHWLAVHRERMSVSVCESVR